MCTVSFIPLKDKCIITSNRDEHISRPLSFQPKEEVSSGVTLIYPKDPKAGGTWYAINEYGTVGVLLNGAFEKHESKGNYARSRGLILIDLISKPHSLDYLRLINLENIEPFTLVLYENKKLIEMRWDGDSRHIKDMDVNSSHIWSSSTLYNNKVRNKREKLFNDFITQQRLSPKSILNFHSHTSNDLENGFVIERKTGLKTFSVTQANVESNISFLDHHDLINKKTSSMQLTTQPPLMTL